MFRPHSTLPPVVLNCDPREYRKADHPRGDIRRTMTRSELFRFGQCPHKWFAGTPDVQTDETVWGSLVDAAALTPEQFASLYAVAPATYPATPKRKGDTPEMKPWNRNATFCAEWEDQQVSLGRTVIKFDKSREVIFAAERIRERFKEMLDGSDRSVCLNVEWHGESGAVVPFKCLLDVLPKPDSEFGDTVIDLKTTKDASYVAWGKTVFRQGYHYQAALYLDAVKVATGLKYRTFTHIIQESDAPYEVTYRTLSDDFVTLGRTTYQSDLRRYCRAIETGNFPGFDCATVEMEAWMLAQA